MNIEHANAVELWCLVKICPSFARDHLTSIGAHLVNTVCRRQNSRWGFGKEWRSSLSLDLDAFYTDHHPSYNANWHSRGKVSPPTILGKLLLHSACIQHSCRKEAIFAHR